MAMTDYLEEKVLNTLRGENIQGFQDVYVALFTSETGDDGSGVEVSGGSYTRQKVTFNEPVQTITFAQVSNDTELDFGVATDDWGLITNAGIYDAQTGGNMIYHGSLNSSKNIEMGDSLRFAINQLIVSQD